MTRSILDIRNELMTLRAATRIWFVALSDCWYSLVLFSGSIVSWAQCICKAYGVQVSEPVILNLPLDISYNLCSAHHVRVVGAVCGETVGCIYRLWGERGEAFMRRGEDRMCIHSRTIYYDDGFFPRWKQRLQR